MKEARDHWFAQFTDTPLNKLVFIDEFGAATNMTRRYARGPRGQRVTCTPPHGHWKVLSTIVAMNSNGIITSCIFDEPIDTDMFAAFVEQMLLKTIKQLEPGQVVVMDNLPAHKSPRIRRLIESAGAKLLLLPAYSPDYNPIEMAISKIKTLLRSIAGRTVDEVSAAIGNAVNSITATDAANYIKHSGYDATIV
ncbi:MAG: IS630 family transposase [Phycisphaerae bacterium]|nr:IS630 family transposase [Phycisphaerae bacterium]